MALTVGTAKQRKLGAWHLRLLKNWCNKGKKLLMSSPNGSNQGICYNGSLHQGVIALHWNPVIKLSSNKWKIEAKCYFYSSLTAEPEAKRKKPICDNPSISVLTLLAAAPPSTHTRPCHSTQIMPVFTNH